MSIENKNKKTVKKIIKVEKLAIVSKNDLSAAIEAHRAEMEVVSNEQSVLDKQKSLLRRNGAIKAQLKIRKNILPMIS